MALSMMSASAWRRASQSSGLSLHERADSGADVTLRLSDALPDFFVTLGRSYGFEAFGLRSSDSSSCCGSAGTHPGGGVAEPPKRTVWRRQASHSP